MIALKKLGLEYFHIHTYVFWTPDLSCDVRYVTTQNWCSKTDISIGDIVNFLAITEKLEHQWTFFKKKN